MPRGTYTYDPSKIREKGKDRMRFELGDTMIEGEEATTALTDEEIQAAVDSYPGRWKRAKLMCLESICRRFAYEPDTKTGPLEFDFGDRAKLWRQDYEELKKEVGDTDISVPDIGKGFAKPPYFHTGMMENGRHEG